MEDMHPPEETVRIVEPDHSLKKKLGDANLDVLLSPEIVRQAQNVITESADQMLIECLQDLEALELALKTPSLQASDLLEKINRASFSLKSKAGLGGYDLASAIAKSLHTRLEVLGDSNLEANNIKIMNWHVTSLRQLLDLKIKGGGGTAGAAIMAELNKLAAVVV